MSNAPPRKPSVLVVYYSRCGATREVAHRLGEQLDCRVECIAEPAKRTGLSGWLRAWIDGALGRSVSIVLPKAKLWEYDLVVFGTPVWAGSVSAPIRAYLDCARGQLRRTAFFLTHGGIGARRTFRQMEALAGLRPEAVLAVTEQDLDDGAYLGQVAYLAHRIRASVARSRSLRLPWSRTQVPRAMREHRTPLASPHPRAAHGG